MIDLWVAAMREKSREWAKFLAIASCASVIFSEVPDCSMARWAAWIAEKSIDARYRWIEANASRDGTEPRNTGPRSAGALSSGGFSSPPAPPGSSGAWGSSFTVPVCQDRVTPPAQAYAGTSEEPQRAPSLAKRHTPNTGSRRRRIPRAVSSDQQGGAQPLESGRRDEILG